MRTLSRVAVATLFVTSALGAQDATVHSTTTVRFLGGFGRVVNMAARFGGKNASEPTDATMYLSGKKMRSDNGDNASVIDLDAGRVISIDNQERTYTSMTFEEMAAMMKGMGDSLKAATARGGERPKGDVDVKYQVSVDRPGEREKIAGYDAERVIMTITMTADVTPEGEKKQEAGSTVFLIDEWISADAPQAAALREFSRAYAQKMGREFEEAVKGMAGAFALNPQLKSGFEAAAKERAKVPGVSLRNTTTVAFVPAGMTFDRQVAMADASAAPPAEEKKGGGLRGMMGGLRKMAEAGKQGEQPAGPPKQSTMMTVKTEVQSIDKGRIDASLFAPPAGYKEVKPNMR